jgi:hypothetical protein
MAQEVQHLPSKHEALNLNPSTVKKKKNNKKRQVACTLESKLLTHEDKEVNNQLQESQSSF